MNPDQLHTRNLGQARTTRPLNSLPEQIRSLVQSARETAATTINSLHFSSRVEIGRLIPNTNNKAHSGLKTCSKSLMYWNFWV